MLISLSVSQFTIAEQLEVEFTAGMTAITGETGAGKSISLDALGLALGDRGDSSLIKHGADKTDIHAVFDINLLPHVQQWLVDNELDSDEDCILRRIITKEGRSKAYINGLPVNLQTLKTLGSQLVDIHSQHAQQRLLQRDFHQQLLDAYGHCKPLLEQCSAIYGQWQKILREISHIEQSNHEADTRREYLQFQLVEFEQLAIQTNEYEQLELQHKQVANAEAISQACQASLMLCDDDEQNVLSLLNQSRHSLAALRDSDPSIREAYELINSAIINVDEACHSLRDRLENHSSPEDLLHIEARLAAFYDLARKHRVDARELQEYQEKLEQDLQSLDNSNEMIGRLEKEAKSFENKYRQVAKKLSKQREKAATDLTQEISQQLQLLGMDNCQFSPQLNTDTSKARASGFENVEFLVSTNPGQPPQALQKIASGGELSRISLAIQVITAKASTIPTLIFDEVDVGIGGATAEVVGDLLRSLGECAQIISVTHQAQVAAKAHHHYFVRKSQQKGTTQTHITVLDEAGKIKEIARMLGGVEITQRTLDHAAEMRQGA